MSGYHLALGGLGIGGAGLAHFIVRVLIFHLIWHGVLGLWHIPAVGPWLVLVLGCALVGLVVARRRPGGLRGIRWLGKRGSIRTGSTGYGTGTGPRDW